ncbi:MAG: FAD-binding oxidoreductase, partial [Bacteriovoracaceae bacterium]
YALPNNCRAGACGECKVRVNSGKFDQGFILDMALPAEERDQGFGLMCMAKPLEDIIEIEWGTEDNKPKLFPPEENRLYIVTEKYMVSSNIAKLKLKGLGKPMRFWPGQYVMMGDPKRCYSIANTPNHDNLLELLITKKEDGQTSKWVHEELQEGSLVKLDGPYGTFIGDPTVDTPVLCLAAGSGLAPIKSLATAALTRGGFKKPATILFSAKTKKDLIELGHFSYLGKKYRNFKFHYTLTQEHNPGQLEGRLTDIIEEKYKDLSSTSIYIAGGKSFVDDCVQKVKELGAKDELVHREQFL